MSASSSIKHLVEWYTLEEYTNDLSQMDVRDKKVKSVYAQIIPKSGGISQFQAIEPEVNSVSVTHTFKCRYRSCPDVTSADWFIYNGKKYQVIDFMEDFKNRQFVDISTKLVYE